MGLLPKWRNRNSENLLLQAKAELSQRINRESGEAFPITHLHRLFRSNTRKGLGRDPLRPGIWETLFAGSQLLASPRLIFLGFITGLLINAFNSPYGDVDASVPNDSEEVYAEVAITEEQLAAKFDPVIQPGDIAGSSKHQQLVSFISGVISVYCPRIANAGEVAREIVENSSKQGLDPLYVAAIISVESRFLHDARSRVGAFGLMQLLPSTAKDVSHKLTGQRSYPRLSDPGTNIELGITYVKSLEKQFQNNRFLALAAYNWGPANVEQFQKGRKRIPPAVRSYSHRILERTISWQNHFKTAEKSAAKLEVAAR